MYLYLSFMKTHTTSKQTTNKQQQRKEKKIGRETRERRERDERESRSKGVSYKTRKEVHTPTPHHTKKKKKWM